MRPRQKPPEPAAPERLVRYVPHEWPGEADPFRAWCRARLDYSKAHPDGGLGDPLDCLAEHRRLRRELS